MVPFEKFNLVSFVSSNAFYCFLMKYIYVFPSRSRFPVKLICCITFGSASTLVVYLNLLQF